MTTQKKVPADVTVLKTIVREQEAELASVKAKLATAEQNAKNYQDWYGNSNKEKAAAEAVIEYIHSLIDACPGALPRFTKTPKKNEWDIEKDRENGIIIRLASFIGARNA